MISSAGILNLIYAKYQKVMLLYDDSVSNIQIQEVYHSIKGICVYNQSEIASLDKNEIFNGYKLIIYFCSVDGFFNFYFDIKSLSYFVLFL